MPEVSTLPEVLTLEKLHKEIMGLKDFHTVWSVAFPSEKAKDSHAMLPKLLYELGISPRHRKLELSRKIHAVWTLVKQRPDFEKLEDLKHEVLKKRIKHIIETDRQLEKDLIKRLDESGAFHQGPQWDLTIEHSHAQDKIILVDAVSHEEEQITPQNLPPLCAYHYNAVLCSQLYLQLREDSSTRLEKFNGIFLKYLKDITTNYTTNLKEKWTIDKLVDYIFNDPWRVKMYMIQDLILKHAQIPAEWYQKLTKVAFDIFIKSVKHVKSTEEAHVDKSEYFHFQQDKLISNYHTAALHTACCRVLNSKEDRRNLRAACVKSWQFDKGRSLNVIATTHPKRSWTDITETQISGLSDYIEDLHVKFPCLHLGIDNSYSFVHELENDDMLFQDCLLLAMNAVLPRRQYKRYIIMQENSEGQQVEAPGLQTFLLQYISQSEWKYRWFVLKQGERDRMDGDFQVLKEDYWKTLNRTNFERGVKQIILERRSELVGLSYELDVFQDIVAEWQKCSQHYKPYTEGLDDQYKNATHDQVLACCIRDLSISPESRLLEVDEVIESIWEATTKNMVNSRRVKLREEKLRCGIDMNGETDVEEEDLQDAKNMAFDLTEQGLRDEIGEILELNPGFRTELHEALVNSAETVFPAHSAVEVVEERGIVKGPPGRVRKRIERGDDINLNLRRLHPRAAGLYLCVLSRELAQCRERTPSLKIAEFNEQFNEQFNEHLGRALVAEYKKLFSNTCYLTDYLFRSLETLQIDAIISSIALFQFENPKLEEKLPANHEKLPQHQEKLPKDGQNAPKHQEKPPKDQKTRPTEQRQLWIDIEQLIDKHLPGSLLHIINKKWNQNRVNFDENWHSQVDLYHILNLLIAVSKIEHKVLEAWAQGWLPKIKAWKIGILKFVEERNCTQGDPFQTQMLFFEQNFAESKFGLSARFDDLLAELERKDMKRLREFIVQVVLRRRRYFIKPADSRKLCQVEYEDLWGLVKFETTWIDETVELLDQYPKPTEVLEAGAKFQEFLECKLNHGGYDVQECIALALKVDKQAMLLRLKHDKSEDTKQSEAKAEAVYNTAKHFRFYDVPCGPDYKHTADFVKYIRKELKQEKFKDTDKFVKYVYNQLKPEKFENTYKFVDYVYNLLDQKKLKDTHDFVDDVHEQTHPEKSKHTARIKELFVWYTASKVLHDKRCTTPDCREAVPLEHDTEEII